MYQCNIYHGAGMAAADYFAVELSCPFSSRLPNEPHFLAAKFRAKSAQHCRNDHDTDSRQYFQELLIRSHLMPLNTYELTISRR